MIYAKNGTGVDAKARQDIQSVTTQLADTVNIIEDVARGNKTPKGRKQKGSIITFITDDAQIEDMTDMYPIFKRQGVPFCTGAIPDRIERYGGKSFCSISDLKILENDGHEILSHSYYHTVLTEQTDEKLEFEMRASKEYLIEKGFKVNNFVTPHGMYDDRVRLLGQKHYRSLRISEGYFNRKPIESFALKGLWLTNESTVDKTTGHPKNSFEHYKYYIDKNLDQKTWLIISTHSWEIKQWGFHGLLEQIVEYAKTKSEILTMNQALDQMENLTESSLFSKNRYYDNHFAISSDGEINSNLMFFKKMQINSVKPTTTIENFEPLVVSICNITHGISSEGFPENKAGVLETYNFLRPESTNGDFGFAYQKYKVFNSDNVYMRSIGTDGTWGQFYLVDYRDNKIIYDNGLTSRTLPNALVKNNITIKPFNTTEAATDGLPEGKAGTLISYTFKTGVVDEAYYFQVYQLRANSKQYIRSAISGTTWGDWSTPSDLNITTLKARGTYTGETLPQDFPKGKVIKTSVSGGTLGMPTSSGGLFTTDTTGLATGSSGDYGYVYQEYRKLATNEVWVRPAASATMWGTWQKITII